jgi:plastocyanin
MRPTRPVAGAGLALVVAACGAGDGPTPPPTPTVATVVITAPAAAPVFGALGRTVQFAAEARDAQGAVVGGVGLTWSSSNTAAATVSSAGLVTAVANGAATITASGGGRTSAGVSVTVSQVAVQGQMSPGNPTIGALGSTRQMSVTLLDSTGNALPGPPPAATWTVSNNGTIAVSGTGLITALAVSTPGSADSVVATVPVGSGNVIAATAVIVTQVAAAVTIAVPVGDSVLRTTGRTRQLTATVRDSNGNALTSQPSVSWTTSAAGVANVNASGLVVAGTTDGSAAIQAAVGAITATRTQVVQRYAATFTLAPASASITTNGGTQGFTATVQDTSATALPVTWLSRAPAVATVGPAAGAATTATAVGNGSTYIVMSGGTRTDSASLTVSGQTGIMAIAVTIGDNFFRSARNNTQNPARDTLAVGGTVTWTWTGGNPHNVTSTGATFTSSTTKSSGTHAVTFANAGTYNYTCTVHAGMSGTVVVQ